MIQKVKSKILEQLKQGATPEKLAQSLTFGVLIGSFPLLGWTTLLALLAGWLFKLNHVVLQSVNYLMYPVQLLLIPVYIEIINKIRGGEPVPVRPDVILKMFTADMKNFFYVYGLVSIYAVMLWMLLSLFLYKIIQILLISKIRNMKKGH